MGATFKVIKIFRAGTHTASDGRKMFFSPALIDSCAATFNPQAGPAPLVLGHPRENGPAFGWVRGLVAKGGELFAEAEFSDKLRDLVKAGSYQYVSAAFNTLAMFSPTEPAAISLRHVGFLGGAAPAVKGLGRVEFAQYPDLAGVAFGSCDLWHGAAVFGASETPSMRVPAGWTVEPARMALHLRALEYRRACPFLSYSEAVNKVAGVS